MSADGAIDWELVAEVLRVLDPDEPRSLPRHRHSMPRDEVERRQRARVLASTATQVAERGYDAVSVSSICAAAGVSSKAFYLQYASKEEAFLGLYVLIEANLATFRTVLDGCTSLAECVSVGADSYLRSLAEQPTVARVLIIDALGATRRIALRRIEAMRAYADTVTATVRRQGAELRPDAAMAFVGAANELIYQHLLTRDIRQLDELSPVLQDLALRILGPDSPGET